MDARKENREMRALPNLPPDIITEILLSLPVKSLMKFRCVSKSWFSLISSSEFIKSHLNHSAKSNNYSNHSILLRTESPLRYYTCSLTSVLSNTVMDNAKVFDIPISSPNSVFWYVGSCNGLLCGSVKPDTLVLYNPSIRSFKTLPVSGTDTKNRLRTSHGFCYDECNDDYKVVQLNKFCRKSMNKIEVKVYSLRNDSWRSIKNKHRGFEFNGESMNVSGIIHWFVHEFGSPTLIFAVNTVTYRCDTLTLPKQHDIIVDEPTGDLVELDGCLCVCYDHFNIQMDVWVMEEYGVKESWTMLYSILYPENLKGPVWPLFMSKNGDICLGCKSYTMMILNSRNKSFTTLKRYTIGGKCSVASPAYIESLVSTSLVGK